ncbi:MAG: hypothetical protein K9L86_03345 [Candidatus Omnitrophica bacterium]|nr:hypothetical protein [Candidatus Omnitrophota bacterium]
MTKGKFILVFAVIILMSQFFVFGQDQPRWQSLCKGSANPYCVAVGKDACNNDSHPIPLRGLELGKVTGVVWIQEGETVSGVGEWPQVAPKNDYYYIIDNDISEPFIRVCSEIEIKAEVEDAGFSSD